MATTPEQRVRIFLYATTQDSEGYRYHFRAMKGNSLVLQDTLELDHEANEKELRKFAKGLKERATRVRQDVEREIE